jgi:hypothetical protein
MLPVLGIKDGLGEAEIGSINIPRGTGLGGPG